KTTEFSSGATISAWVRFPAFGSAIGNSLVEFGKNTVPTDNRVSLGYRGSFTYPTDTCRWTTGRDSLSVANSFPADTTVYISTTYRVSPDSLKIYKDGMLSVSKTGLASPFQFATAADSTLGLNFIGRNNYLGASHTGYIDEVQVSRIARDSNWIKLAYHTQRFGQTALCYPPSIAVQPVNDTADLYASAQFSVTARGNNLSYLWQRSDNGGGSWNTAPGTNTAAVYTFNTAPGDTASPDRLFRCVVSTPYESVTSASALLYVCVPTVITGEPPAAVTEFAGATASLGVTASGEQLSFLWQRSDSAGGAWSAWATAPGASAANPYQFVVAAADSAARFRCIVSGMCGRSDTSTAARLTLCTHISISSQPHDTTTPPVVAGTNAQFSVTASGGKYPLSYQWQWRKLPDANWYPATGASAITATYTLTPAQAGDSGKQYRCLLTSTCESGIPTSAAALAVCTPASIDTNPSNVNVTVGQIAAFHVAASGAGLTYQWQRSDNAGATWNNMSGQTTNTCSFTTTAADTGAGVQFHCVVTSTCGGTTATSAYAQVGLCFPPAIAAGGRVDSQSTLYVVDSTTTTLKIVATGSGLTYQWQRGGTAFGNITGANGATYMFQASRANGDSGARFRCLVTGSCGSIYSDTGTLTVYRKAAITAHPVSDTVAGGDPASFSVTAQGDYLSYQWQVSRDGGTIWTTITGAPYTAYNTSTLGISAAVVTDTNALFRCVVTASYLYADPPAAALTSNPAKLTICFIPDVSNPSNQSNIAPGDWAYFEVNAVVTGNPQYQWEKSAPPYTGGYTPIPGATSRSHSFQVSTADSNTRYRCRVWGGTACFNYQATSLYALLTVCRVLSINTQPASAGVIEGDSVTFFVGATGTGLHYQWQRRSKGSSAWYPEGSDTPAIKLPNLSATYDDGSDFQCIVSAACGTPAVCTTAVASLRVYSRVNAYFDMSTVSASGPFDTVSISGAWPLTVYFRDTSAGDISSCTWNYGDGTPPSTTAPHTPVGHTYGVVTGIRNYTVTLTASGLGGTDVITRMVRVYPASANPVLISGRYLSNTRIELKLENFNSLRSVAPTPYVADSGIKLWRSSGNALPADTALPALLHKTYSLDTVKAHATVSTAGDTIFLDTLTVPQLTAPDSIYSFMTVIKWDFGYFFTPPLDSGNGCRVLMKDTLPPENNLELSSNFLPWDTMVFRLKDVKDSLDSSRVDSIGIWWGEQTTPVDFSDTSHVTWWTAAELIAKSLDTSLWGTPTSIFLDTVKSAQFNTGIRLMFNFVVRLTSRTNDKKTDKSLGFMIGRTVPKTPIKFKAEAHDAGSVRLSWKWDTLICDPDSVTVDSFRIWYAANTAVPLDFMFDTTIYKPVTPDPDISSGEVWVNQLAEKTWYYFGAQMYLGSSRHLKFNAGLWSMVTPWTREAYGYDTNYYELYDTMYSADSVLTPSMASSRIRNTSVITSASFNAETNTLQVFGQADLMGYDTLLLGISYFPRDPAVSKDSLIRILADSTLPVNAFSTTLTSGWLGGFFNHTIDIDQRNLVDNGSFLFDTTYYVLVWLKKSGAQWWSPPTDTPSIATFSVPPFVWQTTRYVFNPAALTDTSYWVNGRVRFVVPPGFVQTVDARIREFTPGDSLTPLDGFLPVGQGFSFIDKRQSGSFQVGIRCDIPPGPYTIQDARVYRYDSAVQAWRVERSTGMDMSNSIIFVSTGGGTALRAPFIAMIDTLPPRISVLSDTGYVLQAFTPVTDSFAVSDNIGNLVWQFYSAKGEDLPALDTSGTLTKDNDTVTTHIDSGCVHWDNGARAMLVADDGHLGYTANISRRVYRDINSIRSPELTWVPLRVTTALDSSSVGRLWQFVPDAGNQYDKRHIRLFRYLADASNADSAANKKWVEYEPGRDSLFEIRPGRLLWIKTRKEVNFTLGRGVTLPLQNNDTVYIQPNGWTDFALPHLFDMRIGDIFDTMNMLAPTYINVGIVPSFKWYQWSYDSSLFQLVYDESVPGLNDRATLLSSREGTGYTIYNPSSETVALFIPPVSAAMSTYSSPSPQPKKAVTTGASVWAVKLMPKTDRGAGLGPVFCGCNEALRGSGWYPLPPTWSGLSVGVLDEKTGCMYGHRILRSMENNGASYLVAFRNDTAHSRTVSLTLERIESFPASMKTAVYDPSTGTTVELSSPQDEFSMNADAGATSCRWLFVGDATYVAAAAQMLSVRKLAFEKISPNPARGLVRLRYSLPFACGKVRFTIFDISGRTLWSRTVEERTPVGGSRECRWDGTSARGRRVAAGVLIVRMEAFDEKGKSAGVFNKRLTFLP
ncbi:MAG: hypothetical protein JW699_00205, partial [Chitinispirillaceae bacterium]|nr:hypothetical protein [Chitinispirillaceae bacterium]